MNAAAWPAPALARVTAGDVVDVVALEYNVAKRVLPLTVYKSAGPWYWIVCPTMPWPGPVELSTNR